MNGRLLYRVPEAAAILGIGRSHCYALVKHGVLPKVVIGRSIRIPAKGLELWVATLEEQLDTEQ